MTPRFPAQCDCLQAKGPRRRSPITGKDESRSHLSGPEGVRLRCIGGIDVMEQTRLPRLRIEGYEGFKGTQRLKRGKAQSFWRQRLVEKQTKFKNPFPQKARGQGPVSAFPTVVPYCPLWVGARSPLAKAEEEEGVISDSRIIKTLSDAHTPNFGPITYSSTRWTGGVLTIAS